MDGARRCTTVSAIERLEIPEYCLHLIIKKVPLSSLTTEIILRPQYPVLPSDPEQPPCQILMSPQTRFDPGLLPPSPLSLASSFEAEAEAAAVPLCNSTSPGPSAPSPLHGHRLRSLVTLEDPSRWPPSYTGPCRPPSPSAPAQCRTSLSPSAPA
jgi:hypothetical protein